MKKDEIILKLKESGHRKVKVAVADIDGVLRGKVMHRDKFLSALEGGFGFCDVVFGWDMTDLSYDNVEVTGWHTGYPDAPAQIDLQTLRNVPWEDGLPFFLADFSNGDGFDLPVCPRSLFKRVIARAKDLGFSPVMAQEFEWFNFFETPQELHDSNFQRRQPLTPGMFGYSILRASEKGPYFHDLFDSLAAFGIPLEGLHTETGPGVYEAAIQYSDALEAADRAVLFKTATKEIAYGHGIVASFMAKQSNTLPGCSGHVHQSLWDPEKKQNLFYDPEGDRKMSALMRSYMAGQLYCLPYILPMFAPTVNSYKRLVEGAWAPTTLTWAVDNRTTALRALPTSPKAARLESRVVGSDVNPYLAMAACLASGLLGIEQNMDLKVSETIGNGYKDLEKGTLPATLIEASNAMRDSQIAKDLFGEDFVLHFTRTREWEWRQYCQAVTDWEYKRYFEII